MFNRSNTQPQVQDIYENQPVSSDSVYAQILNEDRVRNTIAQTSPDNQLAEIEFRIRGFKKNIFTNQWEKINPDSESINNLLVERYISYLSSLLNDGTRYTNLSSMEINNIMFQMIEWLVDDLKSNSDKYKIHGDYSERTRIGHILLNHTFIVLKRSQDGREATRIWKALNLNEQINSQGQQKKGFFDKFKTIFNGGGSGQ
jgi:hypothetical protein